MKDGFNFPHNRPTDDEVQAAAKPGESWAQARSRLEKERYTAACTSALTGAEWQQLVDAADMIRSHCLEHIELKRDEATRLSRARVINLFEYCCAREDKREVCLILPAGFSTGPIDDAWHLISRLPDHEVAGIADSLIGLADILMQPDPGEHLEFLESEGLLKMALHG